MSKLSAEISNRPVPGEQHDVSADSGCPTPLAWQEVLQAVRAERQTCTVEVGSVSLTAWLFGQGEPFYLFPGFVGDHELSVLTSWLLREECCCVMLDPPQSQSADPDMLQQYSQAVIKLADELRHPQFRLHATSFGSLIALQTMLDAPGRVTAASFHCAFGGWKLTYIERMLAAMGRRSSRTLGELRTARRLQSENHSCWFPPFDRSRWDFYLQNVAATPIAEVSRRALIANAVDLHGELDRIQTPILLIDCEGDGRVSAAAQALVAARLSSGRTESLDNCGRLPHLTHPHRLVKLLRAFWETTP